MTTAEIREKTQKMAEGGIDARTIAVDIECRLKRALTPAEAQALQDGWRASQKVRWERTQERDRRTAVEAQQRRA